MVLPRQNGTHQKQQKKKKRERKEMNAQTMISIFRRKEQHKKIVHESLSQRTRLAVRRCGARTIQINITVPISSLPQSICFDNFPNNLLERILHPFTGPCRRFDKHSPMLLGETETIVTADLSIRLIDFVTDDHFCHVRLGSVNV